MFNVEKKININPIIMEFIETKVEQQKVHAGTSIMCISKCIRQYISKVNILIDIKNFKCSIKLRLGFSVFLIF